MKLIKIFSYIDKFDGKFVKDTDVTIKQISKKESKNIYNSDKRLSEIIFDGNGYNSNYPSNIGVFDGCIYFDVLDDDFQSKKYARFSCGCQVAGAWLCKEKKTKKEFILFWENENFQNSITLFSILKEV